MTWKERIHGSEPGPEPVPPSLPQPEQAARGQDTGSNGEWSAAVGYLRGAAGEVSLLHKEASELQEVAGALRHEWAKLQVMAQAKLHADAEMRAQKLLMAEAAVVQGQRVGQKQRGQLDFN